MKIWAANDKIKCVCYSRQPPYHKRYLFVTSKEEPETSLTIYTDFFFYHEKCCGTEYVIIAIPVMSCGYSGKFSQRQWNIQFSKDHLGEQKVLESSFFRLSQSLKFKIFPPVGTLVLPPRYTGFVINLSF